MKLINVCIKMPARDVASLKQLAALESEILGESVTFSAIVRQLASEYLDDIVPQRHAEFVAGS